MTRPLYSRRWLWISILLALSLRPAAAQMGREPPVRVLPEPLNEVGIEQRLGQQLPLNLPFRDEAGRVLPLGQYFNHGRPVILNFVYFDCPMLCGEALNGLSSALGILKFNLGTDFEVVTVSFDPREQSALAAAKKQAYVRRYGRPGADAGWHFLTGEQAAINALTSAAGFHYQWDNRSRQFAHATGLLIVTPEGKIAQYYYGVEYSPKDLRLGLIEASERRIGTPVDQVLLYCYHYDPRTGKYGAVITHVLRLAAAVTVLILGGLLIFLYRHEPASVQQRLGPGGAPIGGPSGNKEAT